MILLLTTKLNQKVKISLETRIGKRRMRNIETLVQEKVREMIVGPVSSLEVVELSATLPRDRSHGGERMAAVRGEGDDTMGRRSEAVGSGEKSAEA